MFRSNPVMSGGDQLCILNELSVEVFNQLVSYLEVSEIGQFSSVNKRFLVALFSNELWADLYYSRHILPTCFVYASSSLGPTRVLSRDRVFVWEQSRDAFIRATEGLSRCRCVPRLESVIAAELSVLTDLAHPSLYQTTGGSEMHMPLAAHAGGMLGAFNQAIGGGAANHASQLHPVITRQYNEAIKYRIHRSRRVLCWMMHLRVSGARIGVNRSDQRGGADGWNDDSDSYPHSNNRRIGNEFISRYTLHNRWNALPMTALQFLCSLESDMRPGSNFEHLTVALAAISRRNAARLQQTTSTLHGLSSNHQVYSSMTGLNRDDEDEDGDDPPSFSSSKKQRYSLPGDSGHNSVQSAASPRSQRRVLNDDLLSGHLHPRDEAALDILLRRRQEGCIQTRPVHGEEEDIESFVHNLSNNAGSVGWVGNVSSSSSSSSSGQV
jgi:hypothetical protein